MFCTSCTILVWFEGKQRKQSWSSTETQKHQQKNPQKTQKPGKCLISTDEISNSMQIQSWNKTWEMFQLLSEEKDIVNETGSMWKRYI